MQDSGLRIDQVAEVRGFADQRLRKPEDPNNDSNRRISVIVKYADAPANEEAGEEVQKAASGSPGHGESPAAAEDHKSSTANGSYGAAPAAANGHKPAPTNGAHGAAPAAHGQKPKTGHH